MSRYRATSCISSFSLCNIEAKKKKVIDEGVRLLSDQCFYHPQSFVWISGQEVRVGVDYSILHGFISAVVKVDIGLRSRHVGYLGEDIPINSEFSELLGDNFKIEMGKFGC